MFFVSAPEPNGELHVRHGQGFLGRHVLQAAGQFWCLDFDGFKISKLTDFAPKNVINVLLIRSKWFCLLAQPRSANVMPSFAFRWSCPTCTAQWRAITTRTRSRPFRLWKTSKTKKVPALSRFKASSAFVCCWQLKQTLLCRPCSVWPRK